MMIDEAIDFCKEKSKNIKLKTDPETFVMIADMLEELKCYQAQHNRICEFYEVATVEDIYNKAIDEVRDMLLDLISNGYEYPNKQFAEGIYGVVNDAMVDVAKQLKAGADNEIY